MSSTKTHLIIPDQPRRPKQYRSNGVCIVCGEEPVEDGRNSYCHSCRLEDDRKRWGTKTREERQSKWLKYKYGKDYEWYHSTWLKQNKSCAICAEPIYLDGENGHKKCCVDHDHETGEVRGLLCHHCNRALGLFKDDVEILSNAFSYLRSYKYDD